MIGGLIITHNAAGQIEHYNIVGYIAVGCGLLSLWVAQHLKVATATPASDQHDKPPSRRRWSCCICAILFGGRLALACGSSDPEVAAAAYGLAGALAFGCSVAAASGDGTPVIALLTACLN